MQERKNLPVMPIDLSTMPRSFGMCNQTECPLANTCLRHLAYTAIGEDRPFIKTTNPKWMAQQKGACSLYLSNQPARRARGFIRTVKAMPTGKAESFRLSAIGKMGYRRYYQCRKGEILLTKDEEDFIISLAKRYGVVLDDYFDKHEEVLMWSAE